MPLLKKVEALRAQFGGQFDALDHWLTSRKELLVLYCKLSLVPNRREALPNADDIAQLCNALVDYVSAGHFEIYEQLLDVAEKRGKQAQQLAKQLFPRIISSTDALVNFGEQYGDHTDDSLSEEFERDLAAVGQLLEERFEYEDALIEALFGEDEKAA